MHEEAQEQQTDHAGIDRGEAQYYSPEHLQLLTQLGAMQRDARTRRN